MLVAIGSLALRQILPNLHPNDVDLIAHPSLEVEFDKKFVVKKRIDSQKTIYDGFEVEWAREGTSSELILSKSSCGSRKLPRLGQVALASPSTLKSIMRAHLCFPVQWAKHMERYTQLTNITIYEDIFKLRQAETAKRFNYKPEKYLQSNIRFFSDGVDRAMPHDSLHEWFKFSNEPAFKSIKYDQESAAIEIDLFNKLSFDNKKKVIWEECLVLGWERTLSKTNRDLSDVAKRFLFGMATNYLPLEFRPFVVDNYKELLDYFPYYKWEERLNK